MSRILGQDVTTDRGTTAPQTGLTVPLSPVVLVVEDDDDVRETTALILQRHGFGVQVAANGAAGLSAATADPPDLALVDIAMPGMDGLRLTAHLRELAIPVILLTARDLPSDVVGGLGAGADDYITKPFDGAVLTARIRAVLRRSGNQQPATEVIGEVISCVPGDSTDDAAGDDSGEVVVDRAAHSVHVGGVPAHLTDTEFRLLTLLLDYRGRVLSRHQILQHVWPDTVGDPRVVDTNVLRLRKRLGENVIRTVRGAGYVIDRA